VAEPLFLVIGDTQKSTDRPIETPFLEGAMLKRRLLLAADF
jgi:hypothetical protein